MVKSLIISLTLLSLLPNVASANIVEVFYDGFWSHHRAAKPLNKMVDSHKLAFKLEKSSIPDEFKNKLFSGFIGEEGQTLPDDYIIYIREYDNSGKLIKEIGGSNDLLWDLSNNYHKILTEKEKKKLHNYIKDVSCIKSDFLSYKKIN